MFSINGNKSSFTQWEQGMQLLCSEMASGDKVYFTSASGESATMYVYEEGGKVVVDVPNRFLQFAVPMTAKLEKNAAVRGFFTVESAKKPEGYEFIDNETKGKPSSNMSGGVASWNDLKDRPFYEEGTATNVLEWDGDYSDKEHLDPLGDGSMVFVKISDAYNMTVEDLIGATITLTNGVDPSEIQLNEMHVVDGSEIGFNGVIVTNLTGTNLFVIIANEDNMEMEGIVFETKGVYFMKCKEGSNVLYPCNLTASSSIFGNKTIKKLDNKFIDAEWMAKEEVTTEDINISVEDLTDEPLVIDGFVKVSDIVLNNEAIKNGIIYMSDGDPMPVIYIWDLFVDAGTVTEDIVFIEQMIVARKDNVELDGIVFPEKGVYFTSNVTGFTTTQTVIESTPLPEKFLPKTNDILIIGAEQYCSVPFEELHALSRAELERRVVYSYNGADRDNLDNCSRCVYANSALDMTIGEYVRLVFVNNVSGNDTDGWMLRFKCVTVTANGITVADATCE